MKACILALLIIFFSAHSALCDSRLAIISDEASRTCADLLTAELSKQQGIELVERDEIDKVMREQGLSINGNLDQQFNLSKLLRAQGMLILEVVKESKGAAVLHARLVAVEPGMVVMDVITPFVPENVAELSKLISARVTPLLPKLAVKRDKAVPISILNVRAVYSAGASAQMEREITTLLASRLTLEPPVFVLERRRLDLLSNEKATGDEPVNAFWNGAYLLDGSIDNGSREGDIAIRLRLRLPGNGGEKTLSVEGSAQNARALVEKLTTQILQATGTRALATGWNPGAEAHQYLDEAVWARAQGRYEEAIEAIESASALGGGSWGEVLFVRASLYAKKAASYPDIDGRATVHVPLNERYDAAMKAVEACQRYLDGKFADKNPAFEKKYQGEARADVIKVTVISTASEVLARLIDSHPSDAPPAEPLRQALRKLEPFDPVAGKLPGDRWDIAYHASYWAESPDELIAYYCAVPQSNDPWQKVIAADCVWRLLKFREAVFNSIGEPSSGEGEDQDAVATGDVSELATPPPDPSRYPDPQGVFKRLVEKLDTNPRTHVIACLIRSGGNAPLEERKAWFGKFLDEFWSSREQLLKEGRYADWLDDIVELDPDVQGEFSDKQLRLLRYFLVNGGECQAEFFKTLWKPQTFPADQAGDIWKEYTAYKQRNTVKKEPDANAAADDAPPDEYAKSFLDVFPQYKPAPAPKPEVQADAPAFVVDWHAYPQLAGSRILDVTSDEDKIWLLCLVPGERAGRLLGIDQQTLAVTDSIDSAPGNKFLPRQAVAARDAIYVLYYSDDARILLSRYDRKAQTWDSRKVPEGATLYVVNGNPYLYLADGKGESEESVTTALARYDWATGKLVYLASNRRKPALNQFDDCDWWGVSSVFEGPGHKVCATMENGPYFVREGPGKWESMLSATGKPLGYESSILGDKTLVYSYGNEARVYYMAPDAKKVEAWAGVKGAPWDIAPEMRTHGQYLAPSTHIGLAPGGFLLLASVKDTPNEYQLHWFRTGSPRTGDTVRLRFKPGDAVAPTIYDNSQGTSGALNTARGVVFWRNEQCSGIWFTRFSEMDDYLKQVKQNAGTSAPAAEDGGNGS